MSDTTDAQGCAFFGYVPPGAYTLSFSKPGYVDPSGQQDITKSLTVAAEQTVPAAFLYDRPGSLTVNFKTRRGLTEPDGSATPLLSAHAGLSPPSTAFVSAANSGVPSGARLFTKTLRSPTDTATSFTLAGLFPFTDGYSVYGANCQGANPVSGPNQVAPAAQTSVATVLPGGSSSIDVRMPAVRFRFPKASNTFPDFLPGQYVGMPSKGNASATGLLTVARLTAESLGCGGISRWVLADNSHTVTTDVGGWIDRPSGRDAEDWGVPVGQYDICVEVKAYDPPGWPTTGDYYARANDQLIKDPNGSTVTLNDFGSGPCA